jgi:hypothetical protein
MMTIDEMRRWLARVNAAVSLALQAQQELDTLSVERHFAIAEGQKKAEVTASAEMARISRKMELYLAAVYQWTRCASLDEVTMLLTDIQVRLKFSYEALDTWRSYLARMEMVDTTVAWTEDVTRNEAIDKGRQLELDYELHVAVLRRLIPDALPLLAP